MSDIKLFEASGIELAKLIREKKISSLEMVSEFIQNVKSINPGLNAIVEERYEQALQDAKLADQELAKNNINFDEKKYFGVPHTIKELLAVNGMKSTMGSYHHKDDVSNFDSAAYQRVKNSGAILMGTTNVPEAAMWFECDNVVYGPGKNPYNLAHTPGGSSGGEAAIIGSGYSPFGVGSDIGGSIRMPAAFCGVFGHKPTEKLIPLTGHFPMKLENAAELVGNRYPFSVVGPLAKKSEDLIQLFKMLVGPDNIDQNIKESYKMPPLIKDWSKVSVYLMPNPSIFLANEAEEDLSDSVVAAGLHFERLGAKVKEAPKDLLYKGFDHWSTRMWSIEGLDFVSYMTKNQKLNYLKEFYHIFIGNSIYTLPALLTAFVDQTFAQREDLSKLIEKYNVFKAKVDEFLSGDSILILPPHPRKAPKLNSTIWTPFDFAYTAVFNALNYPGTIVPMGIGYNGLPKSVQIVARTGMDHLTLSTCETLENEFGGWVKPV